VRPSAHGDSRWSGLVIGRDGICVLTRGSFVDGSVLGRICSLRIVTAVDSAHVARIG
jgi:hypothetical protein